MPQMSSGRERLSIGHADLVTSDKPNIGQFVLLAHVSVSSLSLEVIDWLHVEDVELGQLFRTTE